MKIYPKPSPQKSAHKGFTLIELLVSMTITLLIVGGLVSVTSTALTTFRQSTNDLRGYRQAKTALDQIALDLESLVIRNGNDFEWLNASAERSTAGGVTGYYSELIFLSAVTDRYNGVVTTNPGDVSAVQYGIKYINPISNSATGGNNTFVLYRELTDPDDAFNTHLAQQTLPSAPINDLAAPANFLCENIREFTIAFNILHTNDDGDEIITKVPVLNTNDDGYKVNDFSLTGNAIATSPDLTTEPDLENITSGRIVSIDINLQVISDAVVGLSDSAVTDIDEKIEQEVRRYTKTIRIPQL